MKKVLLAFLSFMLILSIAGCGTDTRTEEDSPIVGKIYMHNTFSDAFDFDYVKFYDDGTFQGIEVVSSSRSENHYGTYAMDGNAITLYISDKTYAGAVLDNGTSIVFDSDEFVDWTGHIKDTDAILEKFK